VTTTKSSLREKARNRRKKIVGDAARRAKQRPFQTWTTYVGPIVFIALGSMWSMIPSFSSRRLGIFAAMFFMYLLGGLMFALFLRPANRKRIKGLIARMATRDLFAGFLVYLLLFIPIGISYAFADKFATVLPRWSLLSEHSRAASFAILFIAYFYGLMVRDLWRGRFRMFAAPLVSIALLLMTMLLLVVTPNGKSWVTDALLIIKEHPWIVAFLIVSFKWGPQITGLIPRVQKAELPGVGKFEIDKLDEFQQQINPWKKTVSRFAELMLWVGDLIEQTPPEDTVKFLAYTPALGFLTRPEGEWRRLYRLLINRTNIQIICLQEQDLKLWHMKFLNKRTARPGGKIDAALIEKANKVSEDIVKEKEGQKDPKMAYVIQRKWDQMPGYYLFANSKRAIIAAPLFLPSDPRKTGKETEAGYLGETPVKMLGFESTDNWTVWLVNQVCDHYATFDVESDARL
jgi:hypothetical protein